MTPNILKEAKTKVIQFLSKPIEDSSFEIDCLLIAQYLFTQLFYLCNPDAI